MTTNSSQAIDTHLIHRFGNVTYLRDQFFNDKASQSTGRQQQSATHRSKILPHTREAGDPYYIGDIYQGSKIRLNLSRRSGTRGPSSTPYLGHIDWLTDNGWPQLRYLGDWMRVTTSPTKWRLLTDGDMQERATRAKMSLIEFTADENRRHDITTSEQLRVLLPQLPSDNTNVKAWVFVVEDLSRDVIEALGSYLDVNPMFFRKHISDYNWYNTRDPWVELPEMHIVQKAQPYYNVRYVQTRYFNDVKSYERAERETGGFNVLRRLNGDRKRRPWIEVPEAVVGTVRSRMSFWAQPRKSDQTSPVHCILLVDPPITEGYPLWGDHNTFTPCPSMTDTPRGKPATRSTIEGAAYWLENLSLNEVQSVVHDPRYLFQQPLCIVCSEWLKLIQYANTRLSQLEWEDEIPQLRNQQEELSTIFGEIRSWRRRFPIYKTFVSETLTKVIRGEQFPGATRNSLLSLEKDFETLLSNLNDLHERAERIMSATTAVMSLDESQKALKQDRSLARLTYLAVTFVPLSFVSSFFSMTEDITRLGRTFWAYFAVAIPITLIALVVVRFSDDVVDICYRFKDKISKARRTLVHAASHPRAGGFQPPAGSNSGSAAAVATS